MKRLFPRLQSFVMTILWLLISGAATSCSLSADQGPIVPGPGGDIVKNGGFEGGGEDSVPGWKAEKKAAGKGEYRLVDSPVHSGKSSLKLSPNRSNDKWSLVDNPLGLGQAFPARDLRGKKLYLSAWLGAEKNSNAVTMLIALRKDGSIISSRLAQSPNDGKLAFHDDVLVVPDDSKTLAVILICIVEGTEGAAYFDDVFVSTTVPATWQFAKAAAPDDDSPLSAEITVDGSRKIRRIPATIYGTNIEWIWDANGIWDKKGRSLNKPLVNLTRDLKTPLIRFPGGIFADFYDWRDGIGPQESRRESKHLPGGPKSVHVFGTDEALDFADKTAARLLITVNAGTGKPEDAADWVKYVNRRPGGKKVDYWEVGNELYIKDGSAHSKASTLPPQKYSRKFLEFAKEMRKADPSIKIGAISDENFGSLPSSYQGWLEELLTTAGNEVDFVAVHNAYAPAIWMDKGWPARSVYSAMLAAPLLIRDNLDLVSRKIEKAAPSRSSHIKIAVTEWGPYFQTEPSSRFVDHGKTLGSALFTASTLKVFIENPRVEVANYFQLVDALFMGSIGVRGNTFTPKAPYYAIQMYTRHFGEYLIHSSTTSPTYNSPSVGRVDAVSDVPYLDIVASEADGGKTFYIMGINKNLDKPIKATINLKGIKPRAKGTAWILTGKSVDANTGTELFRAPGVKWAQQAEMEKNPQFSKGSPSEINITSVPLNNLKEKFEYVFPPHSVVSLQITGN